MNTNSFITKKPKNDQIKFKCCLQILYALSDELPASGGMGTG
jgi:hypothetical protein